MSSCPLPRPAGATVSPRAAALGLLLALGALLGSAALLRQLRPIEEEFPLDDRLTWYLEHAEAYDVLFIGTSRVYRSVVPEIFDRRMARHGLEVRSFNLGAPGMRAFETDRLVRFLMKRRGERLRYVFLERGDYDPRPRAWEADTARAVAWHTPRQTWAAMRASWRLDAPPIERWAQIATHAGQFLRRQLNYGVGPSLVRGLLPKEGQPTDWSSSGGYRSLESEDRRVHRQRRRRFLRHLAAYERTVARNSRRRRPPRAVTEASLAALVEQGRFVRSAGAEPILLIGPNDGRLRGVEPGDGELALLNFDDPVRFPDLFAPERRFDSSHLTEEGARLYSRLLADELVAALAGAGD